MGYFDGLTDAYFKKDATGNTLFYPWGVLGSGLVVESEEKAKQLRGLIKKQYIVMFLVIILGAITNSYWMNVAGYWPVIGFCALYLVGYHLLMRGITKGLTKSTEKLRLSESSRNSAKSHNLPTLIVIEILGLGMVASGVWIYLSGKNPWVAFLGVGFFGLCCIVIGYMIVLKIRARWQS